MRELRDHHYRTLLARTAFGPFEQHGTAFDRDRSLCVSGVMEGRPAWSRERTCDRVANRAACTLHAPVPLVAQVHKRRLHSLAIRRLGHELTGGTVAT